MQSQSGHYGAYSMHQRETETPRESDARALLNCANQLELVKNPECSYNDYVTAIRLNQRLWTIFQVCLTDPSNQLPQPVKLSLFQLSRHVDRVSFTAIAKRSPEALDGLININRQIAAGLSAHQPAEQSAQTGQTTTDPTQPPTQPITTFA